MKKFRFKLETLLGVTRRKKEDAERLFAEATRKLEEERSRPNTRSRPRKASASAWVGS